MPRYYFHVHDGESFIDLQGTELADVNATRLEAIRFSCALINDNPAKFWTEKGWSMEVCDDYGVNLFTLRFSAEEAPSVARIPYAKSANDR